MAKKKGAALKVKRKNWFKIIAPSLFRNQIIGESLVDSPDVLLGKGIKVNLSNLTGDMKKQGTVISFKVINASSDGGKTDVIGYNILPATLKRFVRRGIKTINNSFECVTADGIKVRIKPLIFTRNISKGGISTILNKTAKFSLIKSVKSRRYNDLFFDVISAKIQRDLKDKLNKLYPIKMVEIKSLVKVEGEVNEEEEPAEKKEEAKKEPEPKEEKPKKEEKAEE